jgi:hypothetical protein
VGYCKLIFVLKKFFGGVSMYRRLIILICACVFAACINGCDNDCCSVTPETRYAHIELYPGRLDFRAVQAGPLPAAQKVFLFNSGSSCLGWKATSSDPWLECHPDSGFTGNCGDTDTLRVSVNTTSLEKGTHTGNIYIQSDDADNNPGNIAVTYSVVSLSDIFLIKDAWWTDTVDADSNGCVESARLTWDADVLDGSTREVSAQVFYRQDCTSDWIYYFTTSCWTITGEDTDDTYFVTVDNLPVAEYEFSIILYQCGGSESVATRDNKDDNDLNNRCFESLVTYSIYDAWWADESDVDGDGCRDSGKLAWDADVNEGLTRSVQGHVYYRLVGEYAWTYYRSTACYDITGKNRDDAYFLSMEGLEPGRYEFIIDLYECNGHGKAAERSNKNDADLADQCFDEYVPPPSYSIHDTWWTGGVDEDADGYYESRTLVCDANTDQGLSGTVLLKVFYLPADSDIWMMYGESECFEIEGWSEDDTFSVEVTGLPRNCYQFGVQLFACADPDRQVDGRGPTGDDDLENICFEPDDVSSVQSWPAADPVSIMRAKTMEGWAPAGPGTGTTEAVDVKRQKTDVREGSGSPNPGAD